MSAYFACMLAIPIPQSRWHSPAFSARLHARNPNPAMPGAVPSLFFAFVMSHFFCILSQPALADYGSGCGKKKFRPLKSALLLSRRSFMLES